MAPRPPVHSRSFLPDELLGPLSEAERIHAPKALWASGRTDLLRDGARVAVVGSRRASALGLARATRLADYLARRGVVVLSGLAAGIDSAAHRAAITAGGGTIAVLGTPLDRVYPAENRALQEEIASRHLAISEFAPGSTVRPSNFVRRNRTIALLAHASVIVEAGESSGSLSQGWETLRLGRLLFLLSSVVRDPRLRWPAQMLEHGAIELSRPEGVLDHLPLDAGRPLVAPPF